MKKAHKALIILAVPFLLGFLLGFVAGGGFSRKGAVPADVAPGTAVCVQETSERGGRTRRSADLCDDLAKDAAVDDDVDGLGAPERKEIIYHRNRLPYAKLFADLNEKHLEVARELGLSSVPRTREDFSSRGLVKIEDNEYYIVDDLSYSIPYLTKGAAEELERIARAFSDSLKSKNLLPYKLIVSSLLRTEEDVQRLKRSGNPNASDNSAHCYGTTFDITYTRYFIEDESEVFMQPFELTKVLGEVLLDEKNASRCLVKYERKEHCFHITSCVK